MSNITITLPEGGNLEAVSRYAQLYKSGRLCDVTLRAVGTNGATTDFNVHRVIMAGASDYWEGLLASNWPLEAGRAVISVQTEPRALDVVVRHIYGMKVIMGLDMCVHVVNAADMFLMERLKDAATSEFIRAAPTLQTHKELVLGIALSHVTPMESKPRGGKRQKLDEEDDVEGHEKAMISPIFCGDPRINNFCWKHVCENDGVFISDDSVIPSLPLSFVRRYLHGNSMASSEIDLFRWAAKWCAVTGTPFAKVARHLRYPLMTIGELVEVENTGLVDASMLLLAYRVREGGLKREDGPFCAPDEWLAPRGHGSKTVDVNVSMADIPRMWEGVRGKNGYRIVASSGEFEMEGLQWRVEVRAVKRGKTFENRHLQFLMFGRLGNTAETSAKKKGENMKAVCSLAAQNRTNGEWVLLSGVKYKKWKSPKEGTGLVKYACSITLPLEELGMYKDQVGMVSLIASACVI